MRKLKYIIVTVLIISSFYFTNEIMLYIDNRNPIMQEIVSKQNNYNTKAVNAVIDNNTIIPGISGKKINKHKSLLKMNEFGSFNDIYLIYDKVKPKISLDDNKDKVIIKGNNKKRMVSLILEDNKEIENYLDSNKIKYTLIASINTIIYKDKEYINGELNEKNFSDLNSLFNKNKINNKLCLVNYSNYNSCIKEKYYIVSNSLSSKDGYFNIINSVNNGDIILIDSKFDLNNIKLVINELKRQDLDIVYLSELIKE